MDPITRGSWIGQPHGIMAAGRSSASDVERSARVGSGDIAVERGSTRQPLGPFDDRVVVGKVLDGDVEAFRWLVERDGPAVVRACHRVLGDLAEAEDVAQEAFVIAYRSLGTWRAEGPFGAWLTRIAVRLALRQASRRRTVSWVEPGRTRDASDAGPADRAADRAAVAATPWTDPAQIAIRAERATEVRTAVIALPEPYREVVALRFFGEASLEEIARETGRPLGTVKTHLHRGLARLRDRLEERSGR